MALCVCVGGGGGLSVCLSVCSSFFFVFFFFVFPPSSTLPSIVDFQYVYEFYMPMTMQLRVVSTITILLNIG